MYKFIKIIKSKKKGKKYDAIFENLKTGRTKVLSFGAKGYSDYTKHKDKKRKERYISRHKKRENWNDLMSRGALSRFILWNKPTLKASIEDYKKRVKRDFLNQKIRINIPKFKTRKQAIAVSYRQMKNVYP